MMFMAQPRAMRQCPIAARIDAAAAEDDTETLLSIVRWLRARVGAAEEARLALLVADTVLCVGNCGDAVSSARNADSCCPSSSVSPSSSSASLRSSSQPCPHGRLREALVQRASGFGGPPTFVGAVADAADGGDVTSFDIAEFSGADVKAAGDPFLLAALVPYAVLRRSSHPETLSALILPTPSRTHQANGAGHANPPSHAPLPWHYLAFSPLYGCYKGLSVPGRSLIAGAAADADQLSLLHCAAARVAADAVAAGTISSADWAHAPAPPTTRSLSIRQILSLSTARPQAAPAKQPKEPAFAAMLRMVIAASNAARTEAEAFAGRQAQREEASLRRYVHRSLPPVDARPRVHICTTTASSTSRVNSDRPSPEDRRTVHANAPMGYLLAAAAPAERGRYSRAAECVGRGLAALLENGAAVSGTVTVLPSSLPSEAAHAKNTQFHNHRQSAMSTADTCSPPHLTSADEGHPLPLLTCTVDVNAEGASALHIAVRYGLSAAAEALLDAGADPNALDANGRTPLHYAAMYDATTAVEALLEAGADHSLRDCDGHTCLTRALYDGSGLAANALNRLCGADAPQKAYVPHSVRHMK